MRSTAAVVTALATIALLAWVQVAGGASTVPPTWEAELPKSTVAFGSTLNVVVYGPPHATFLVSLYAPPFNYTPPIVTYSYTLGNATNSTKQAVEVAYLPTSELLEGSEMVRVYNDSFGTVLSDPFVVNPAPNGTVAQLQEQYANLNALYSALVNHTVTQQNRYDAAMAYSQHVVELVIVATIANVLVVIWTRPEVDLIGWVRRWKRTGHDIVMETDAIAPGYTVPLDGSELKPVPSRSYVGGKAFRAHCVRCQVPASEAEKVLHLQRDHGIANPKQPGDYHLDRKVAKGYMAEVPRSAPLGSRGAARKAPSDAARFVGDGKEGLKR